MYAPGYAPGLYLPGHAPGLSLGATVTAEPGRGARMPAAAGRANWGAWFTPTSSRNCARRAHWQAAPGRAHRLGGACARRHAWRRLSDSAGVPRRLSVCSAAHSCRT